MDPTFSVSSFKTGGNYLRSKMEVENKYFRIRRAQEGLPFFPVQKMPVFA